MRKAVELLSLAVVVGVAGCAREQSTESAEVRAPARDLTLQTPSPASVAIASPVELERPVAQRVRSSEKTHSRPRKSRSVRQAAVREASVVEPTAEASPALAPAPAPAPVPVAEPAPAGAGRELAPGETITVIPASAGPSSSDGDELDLPAETTHRGIFIGRGGGTCRPRAGGVRGFRITVR